MFIECPYCSGVGGKCDKCGTHGGRPGMYPIFRCPNSVFDARLDLLFRAWAHMKDGIPPVPGGYLDQSYTFLRFCTIVDREKLRHEEMSARERTSRAGKGLAQHG